MVKVTITNKSGLVQEAGSGFQLDTASGLQADIASIARSIDAVTGTGVAADSEFTITVPVAAGGTGNAISIKAVTPISDAGNSQMIHILRSGTAATMATNIALAINGSSDATKVRYGAAAGTTTSGIAGVQAIDGSTTALKTIEAANPGLAGDTISLANTTNSIVTADGLVWSACIGGVIGKEYSARTEFIPDAQPEDIAAGNPGPISAATYFTSFAVDAGGDAFTLASGGVIGQRKLLLMTATGGGAGVVVLTTAPNAQNDAITFTVAGDMVELVWMADGWHVLYACNIAAGTAGGRSGTPAIA